MNVVLLAGGVGGAKLADGLAQILPPEKLTVIANTGDDFQLMGLTICPDLDTIMYTLAGAANTETGWGRADETWRSLGEVGRLGGPDWFRIGDLDLATHLVRTHLLAGGQTLTEASQHLCKHFGIKVSILPMSDQPAPTVIDSDQGTLPFQEWFVARHWKPAVRSVCLPEDVRATSRVAAALQRADVVIIAPSNPFVSIDPILNVYPIRAMVDDLPELTMAVSPIVAGQALKGPAAKMMDELGMEVSSQAVAEYYGELVDIFIYDKRDGSRLPEPAFCTDTIMLDQADRRRLASQILEVAMEYVKR